MLLKLIIDCKKYCSILKIYNPYIICQNTIQNYLTHKKTQENKTYIQEKRQTKENDPEKIKWLELADKEFKAAVVIMFKDVNATRMYACISTKKKQ